ncbi:O-antigen polymerase [Xenorhabdus nematophila]|uniref:O-antigen polymerase n=1 Tax=Xenorhabdus nematophila TaxID=628 RepID=UPI0032B78696
MLSGLDSVIFWGNILLLIVSFLLLIIDFYNKPASVMMNIYAFGVVFGAFYYGLPFINIEYLYEFFGYSIDDSSLRAAKIFALWTLFIFFCYYCFSRKKHMTREFSLQIENYSNVSLSDLICYIVLILAPLVAIIIIIDIGSNLLSNFSDRVAAQAIYVQYEVKFKLPILFFITLSSYFFMYVKGKMFGLKRIFFLSPFIICIPEILSGGRDLIFAFIIFNFIIYSLRNSRRKILLFFIPLFATITSMVIARYYLTRDITQTSIEYAIYSMLAEFYHTAFTTAYIFDRDINNIEMGGDYLFLPLLKFFMPILSYANEQFHLPWYADLVSERIGRSFGFAGNIISESYYYFGYIGCFLYPFFIATILGFHNRFAIKKNKLGLITLIIVAINIRLFFRGSFWDNYTSIIIWLVIYFCITGLIFSRGNEVVKIRVQRK